MVQDIFPHKFHNEYDETAAIKPEDVVLNIVDGRVLLNTDKYKELCVAFPKALDFSFKYEYRYLFSIDAVRYFLLDKELEDTQLPEGYSYVSEKEIRQEGIEPMEEVFASITGKHLSDWYRDTKFCGRCGSRMVHSQKERAMTCPSCKYTAYPRIMPAVIVGVTNGDSILITRYRTGFAHNALIAGFTEIGETVEETVSREVLEEAGIRVKNIRYYKSQPWGSANDILLGFYCDVDGDDSITMDSSELKYAQWVKRDDIVLQPGSFSLTNEMMKRFKDHEEV